MKLVSKKTMFVDGELVDTGDPFDTAEHHANYLINRGFAVKSEEKPTQKSSTKKATKK